MREERRQSRSLRGGCRTGGARVRRWVAQAAGARVELLGGGEDLAEDQRLQGWGDAALKSTGVRSHAREHATCQDTACCGCWCATMRWVTHA